MKVNDYYDNPSTRFCRLCATEAYHIVFSPGGASLNKRDEFFGHLPSQEEIHPSDSVKKLFSQ